MISKYNKKIFYFSIAIFLFISFTSIVRASTEIYLIPDRPNIKTGEQFIVDLKVSSSKDSINVVDGTIIYDKDKLEIKKISIENSTLSIWPKPVIFDNEKGELNFVGGVGNGFSGQDRQVLRIFFQAKKEGKTKIDFRDNFTVYLNDGKGTQINPWLRPIDIFISPEDINQWQTNFIFNNFLNNKSLLLIISVIALLFVVIFILKKYVTSK